MSDGIHPATEDLQRQFRAVDIDLKCALAFNRALLKGLAATSAQARHALDAALDEELRIISFEDTECAAAAHKMVDQARAELGAASPFRDRLARDIEQAIVDCASAMARDDYSGVEDDQDENYRLRSCA